MKDEKIVFIVFSENIKLIILQKLKIGWGDLQRIII